MKNIKLSLASVIIFFICACLYCPVFHAMPKFMERYNADPYAKGEKKDRCTVCHTNEEGFGPLNKLGQAFAKNGYRITGDLRKQATEAFSSSPAEADKVEPKFEPKAFFARNCAVCHGADGKGSDAGMIVPNFSDAGWQRRHDDQKLITTISKGKGTMPAFKDKLSEEQIESMAEFIRTFADQK